MAERLGIEALDKSKGGGGTEKGLIKKQQGERRDVKGECILHLRARITFAKTGTSSAHRKVKKTGLFSRGESFDVDSKVEDRVKEQKKEILKNLSSILG